MEFGKIISGIETILTEEYGKDTFKTNMQKFKRSILENKNLSKSYYIYTELMSPKGINPEIVDEYLNESLIMLETLIKKESKNIEEISHWVNENLSSEPINGYHHVDNLLYNNKSLKNLESVLESKNKLRQSLIESKKQDSLNESINIPIPSMIKIATNVFNSEYNNILSETEKDELRTLLRMSKEEISEGINETRTIVTDRLLNTLNESKEDLELSEKINQTIKKINESDESIVTYYKLKQLEKGLD